MHEPGHLMPAVLAAVGIALVLFIMWTLGAVPAEPTPRTLTEEGR